MKQIKHTPSRPNTLMGTSNILHSWLHNLKDSVLGRKTMQSPNL